MENVFLGVRFFKLLQAIQFLFQRKDTIAGHSITQIVYLRLSEFAFFDGKGHSIIGQPLKNLLEDLIMSSLVLGKAKHII